MHRIGTRRPWIAVTFCVALAAASAARAGNPPSCSWVDDVQVWDGDLSWSWSHHDSWSNVAESSEATVSDTGTGTFVLEGFPGAFSGDIDGSLQLDDNFRAESLPSHTVSSLWHTVLQGAIGGPQAGTPAKMDLITDSDACTYTWIAHYYGDGMRTTEVTSYAVREQPNVIFPGNHPIPELPQPLSFSGSVPVVVHGGPGDDPVYVPASVAADNSLGRTGAPAPSPASVSWSFEPRVTAPLNDTCDDASFLFGSDAQDTRSATSDASDPASSCGTGDRSVWYFFSAPAAGTAHISTSGSGYSTIVSVWPLLEPCGALTTQVACGSNGASVPVQANTVYRMQVQRSGSGTGVLHVSMPEPSAAWAPLAAFAALAQIRRVRRAPRQLRRRLAANSASSAAPPPSAAAGSGT